MSVTYELIEGPYPYLCALYRCSCGATVVRHGAEAGAAPTGWQERSEGELCLCPACAARATAAPAPPR